MTTNFDNPPLPSEMPATEDVCKCGRAAMHVRPHCPKCGALFVVAVQRNGRTAHMPDGSTQYIQGYRCRQCGQQFQADWPCAAPVKLVGQALRSKSELDKAIAKIPKRIREKKLEQARKIIFEHLQKTGRLPNPDAASPSNASDEESERPAEQEVEVDEVTPAERHAEDETKDFGDLSNDPLFRR